MILVYIGLIFILILQSLRTKKNISHRFLCFCILVFLFLVSSLNSIEYGSDLHVYASNYDSLFYTSYRDILLLWQNGILKDPVFFIVAKFFSSCYLNVYVWFAFIALLFSSSVYFFILKYSPLPFISCLLLASIGVLEFTMSGLRQTMAIAFILFSYHFIIKDNLKNYLVCLSIAFLFHSSALIFLPAYWLSSYRIGAKQIMLLAINVGLCVLAPMLFRSTLGILAWNESIANYQHQEKFLTWSGFIIQSFPYLLCYLYRNNVRNEKKAILKVCLNCMTIGLCLQAMATVIAEAFRAAYYYNLCSIIALPLIIDSMKTKDKSVIYLFTIVALFSYMIWAKKFFGYIYFWENV